MTGLVYLPFLAQALLISVDEFYFHHRRGLPAWERWGHPLDTLSAGAVYLYLAAVPAEAGSLGVVAALSIFSCVFVTKDEFLHKELCEGTEQWIHSLLFLVHPCAFFAATWIWWEGQSREWLEGMVAFVGAFFSYQLIYWGALWPRKRRWITRSTSNTVSAGIPPTTIR
jgi:hypothetical protein